jgi:ABC-type polar amino acid transport system ATPase subunit
MLTSLTIRNFKRLKETEQIHLDEAVVFIGPNNSGKTTALQALILWWFGVRKWMEKRVEPAKNMRKMPNGNGMKRTGVPINRKELFAIPVAHNKLMWTDLFVLSTTRDGNGKIIGNRDVNIEVEVEGITNGQTWRCGLEFEYRDEEVLYCRPLKNFEKNAIIESPDLLRQVNVAFLPPMSGLKTEEEKLLNSTVEARIGEGRTAEVLRNVCYQVLNPETDLQRNGRNPMEDWIRLCGVMEKLFLVKMQRPEINYRGELILRYVDERGNELEVASAGRGLQQILLLVSYMLTNPNALMLFDEPDAHLEVLKQGQVYRLLKDLGREKNVQIISASHSEVILRESANEDVIVGFLPAGKPRQINDKGSQVLKSLNRYGFDQYVFAEQRKWVLYLEGSTDLDMLKRFANRLKHPVVEHLSAPFVSYLGTNVPSAAREHFYALKQAVPSLQGVALFDRINNALENNELKELMWSKREMENYFFSPDVFLRYATGRQATDLFALAEQAQKRKAMEEAIEDVIPGYARRNLADPFWSDDKASEWMERVFRQYFENLRLPVTLSKNKYFQLIDVLDFAEVNHEINDKLDAILHVAAAAALL